MFNLKKTLLWVIPAVCLAFSTVAGEIGHLRQASITLHNTTLALEPASPSSQPFQIAGLTFLPDYQDGDFGWNTDTIPRGSGSTDECAGYTLSACPDYGKCSKCLLKPLYKLDSCDSGFSKSGNACVCPSAATLTCSNDKCSQYCGSTCITKTCTPSPDQTGCTNGTQPCDDGCCGSTRQCCIPCVNKITTKPENSSYTYSSCTDSSGSHQIQTGWSCNSGYFQDGNACIQNCIIQNCSDYTLTTCPANAICSSCTKTAASCATDGTYLKLDSCEPGYEVSGNSCVVACSLPTCSYITTKPANSSYITTSCTDCSGTKTINSGWTCNSGYTKSGENCVRETIICDDIIKSGSYVYEDHSFCSQYVSNKILRGILVDPGYNLVIALHDIASDAPWEYGKQYCQNEGTALSYQWQLPDAASCAALHNNYQIVNNALYQSDNYSYGSPIPEEIWINEKNKACNLKTGEIILRSSGYAGVTRCVFYDWADM